MPTITTWLWFDAQAVEAATFSTSLFDHSRITGIDDIGGLERAVAVILREEDGRPRAEDGRRPDHPGGGRRRAWSPVPSLI